MSLVPNVSAEKYTLSAFIVGLIISEGSNVAEENALGNWFMLVGQTLCTKASQQQVLNNRNNLSSNSNVNIVNDEDLIKSAQNIKKEVNNIFTSH